MGTILKKNRPCQRCSSSDASQTYDDGWTHCFSCGAHYRYQEEGQEKVDQSTTYDKNLTRTLKNAALFQEIKEEYPTSGLEHRLIPKPVCEFYNIKVSYNPDGKIEKIYYPFANKALTETVGYKCKDVKDKKNTFIVGNGKNIFGLEHFKNGDKRIIITEGEEDCLSVATAYWMIHKTIYPVVSMGGAQQIDYLLENKETLDKFDTIYLWFDNDEQGQAAIPKAAKILGYHKVRVVTSNEKDANDMLLRVGIKEARRLIETALKAKEYSPAGVIAGEDTWERYQEFKNLTFIPWPPFLSKLNELTYGRALGTITMFPAGTGVGKSSLLREDIYHLLNTTDYKLGACFLEEDIGETVSGIMSLHLNKRIGLPSAKVTPEEEKLAWSKTVGLPNRCMLIDHQGSVSDGSLINKLEYLALLGCQLLYLDHITIAVSESEENDVNKAIDIFMSDLLKLVKRHNVWVGVVSHLRKVRSGEDSFERGAQISEDDLKGSGSLKQISFQTIALSRNKYAEDESDRNLSQVWLLKDRKTGNTGPAGKYRFDRETGRLIEVIPKSLTLEPTEFEIIQ